jgi:hypothetical protein
LVLQAALDSAPPASRLAATLRANLGAAQRDRYAAERSVADLDAAIGHLAAAVEMSSPRDADRARRLFGLALATRDRWELSHQLADLTAAIDAYQDGCAAGGPADPLSTLVAAQEWGAWATERRDWPEAAAAFGVATEAMLAVVQAQVIREHKENWLRDAAGLPGRAAYAAAQARRLPGAVAGVEAGRAAILAETLRRGELDLRRLAVDRPDLAGRYTRAASRLRVAQGHRPGPGDGGARLPFRPGRTHWFRKDPRLIRISVACFARDSTESRIFVSTIDSSFCNQTASAPVLIEPGASFRLSALAPGGQRWMTQGLTKSARPGVNSMRSSMKSAQCLVTSNSWPRRRSRT